MNAHNCMRDKLLSRGCVHARPTHIYRYGYYWDYYDQAWSYALAHFIDQERGGWYPMMNQANERVGNNIVRT